MTFGYPMPSQLLANGCMMKPMIVADECPSELSASVLSLARLQGLRVLMWMLAHQYIFAHDWKGDGKLPACASVLHILQTHLFTYLILLVC